VTLIATDPVLATTSLFSVRLAQSPQELLDCQRLRYLVFNVELREGLSTSDRDGLDIDPFDPFCDHLMVRDLASGKLVGTYRLQTGRSARRNLGYYCNQLFDFSVYEPIRPQLLELGRACVHQDFRNSMVLHALWKGIAIYATRIGSRYLVGCNSISSQDEDYGLALYHSLKEKYSVDPFLQTVPQPGCQCSPSPPSAFSVSAGCESSPGSSPASACCNPPSSAVRPPRLFRAYLEVSARIAAPPAIDREFKTIDFLTLVDLANLPDRVRSRFF
jgi:putative hemolysin